MSYRFCSKFHMPFGTVVALGPGDIVLDGSQLPSPPQKKRHSSPQFSARVCCGQTAETIKMPLTMEVGLGPGDIVLDEDPAPPPKGHSPLPNFRPMSVVAKRSPISATAEHLIYLQTNRRTD